ncbi:MAG: 2-C-methyl-D-erythritol 2,4-cyclodiphosphate synthase [Angelakisella sp.]
MGLLANSDGDVVLHAITNAVSGITGRNILGRWLMRCAKAASPIQRNTCGKP